METKTVYVKLVAEQEDIEHYITYVFEVLDTESRKDIGCKYVMCVRYPNWNEGSITLQDTGFLKFIEVVAGEDKWFDGTQQVPYKYSNWQFIKFISDSTKIKEDLVLD